MYEQLLSKAKILLILPFVLHSYAMKPILTAHSFYFFQNFLLGSDVHFFYIGVFVSVFVLHFIQIIYQFLFLLYLH